MTSLRANRIPSFFLRQYKCGISDANGKVKTMGERKATVTKRTHRKKKSNQTEHKHNGN